MHGHQAGQNKRYPYTVRREIVDISVGKSMNDWAIPFHVFAGKPYTDQNDRWVSQIVFTVFCFYLAITWPSERLVDNPAYGSGHLIHTGGKI